GLRGDRDVDPGLADDLRGVEDEAVRGAAETGAGHPRDRVDVDVELRPDERVDEMEAPADCGGVEGGPADRLIGFVGIEHTDRDAGTSARSEEHTSELQSRFDLVCRLLLEKTKKVVI